MLPMLPIHNDLKFVKHLKNNKFYALGDCQIPIDTTKKIEYVFCDDDNIEGYTSCSVCFRQSKHFVLLRINRDVFYYYGKYYCKKHLLLTWVKIFFRNLLAK